MGRVKMGLPHRTKYILRWLDSPACERCTDAGEDDDFCSITEENESIELLEERKLQLEANYPCTIFWIEEVEE